MTFVLLALGIALEVAGTLCMKASNGFQHWRAGLAMYILYALSLTTLTFAFKRLDVSVGYAIWSGAGVVLIVAAGVFWYREPATTARLGFIALILVGLIGLHLISGAAAPADNAPARRHARGE